MKCYPVPAPRSRRLSRSVPAFHAVPGRARADGWTPQRQAQFIAHLFQTRSVAHAAQRVAMARETAYRLRRRPWSDSFCAAWDAALGDRSVPVMPAPRKVTTEELRWRAETGIWKVQVVGGRYAGLLHRPDNTALLRLLARVSPRPAAGAALGRT